MRGKRCCFIILVLLLTTGSAYAAQVLVILSRAAGQYQDALTGFKAKTTNEIELVNLEGDVEKGKALMATKKPALAVAIGPEAAMSAQALPAEVPVLYTMVLSPMTFPNRVSSGVLMRITNEQQFSMIKKMMPDRKNLAVIYNPQFSNAEIDEARKSITTYGLQLLAYPISSLEDISGALEKASASRADLLWLVLDKTLMQPAALKQLMAFSHDKHVPLIGLSLYHINEGALAAFACNFTDLGMQTAELANTYLSGQSLSPTYYPRLMQIYINNTIMAKLKLENFIVPANSIRIDP